MPEAQKDKEAIEKDKQDAGNQTSSSGDQKDRGYYYDDAHGYEVYDPNEDENDGRLRIWTIGHSTLELREFIELLRLNEIETLADVRSYPGSRRFPHFGAAAIGRSLGEIGVEYVPLKHLGGRRPVRADSPRTVWRNKAFRGYADYMETDEFTRGIDELLELARKKRTAIMCAEAVWWRCHRSMIADYLKATGVAVEHIMGAGKNVVHPYTAAAKIVNGRLVYGSANSDTVDGTLPS